MLPPASSSGLNGNFTPDPAPVFLDHVVADSAEEGGNVVQVSNPILLERAEESGQRLLNNVVDVGTEPSKVVSHLVSKLQAVSLDSLRLDVGCRCHTR